jgi:hypothetical protein
VPHNPRQQIKSVPYAVRSATSGNADQLGGVNSSQFVQTNDPRLTDARTPTAGSTFYIHNGTGTQAGANFDISGTGEAAILNARTQFNFNGSRILSSPGTNNTFLGSNSGTDLTTGGGNSFLGEGSGAMITSGNFNVFVGGQSGPENTTGSENTYVGYAAGLLHQVGQGNSFFGTLSGRTNINGSFNTLIGSQANVQQADLTFATAIGAGAVAITSNIVQLGRDSSDSVRIGRLSIGGATAICLNGTKELSHCSSSLRYKENINDFRFGVDIINQLKPISYDWKHSGIADVGFGAEDVAKIDPTFVTFNEKGEVEGVKYDRFSVLFVNAFKEQQKQIEGQQLEITKQKTIIERQQSEIELLKRQQKEFVALKALVCSNNTQAAVCQTEKIEIPADDSGEENN